MIGAFDLTNTEKVLVFLMSIAGSGLSLFLLTLFFRKRPSEQGDLPAAAATAVLLVWFALSSVPTVLPLFLPDSGPPEEGALLALPPGWLFWLLALAFLFHAAIRWGGIASAWAWVGYGLAICGAATAGSGFSPAPFVVVSLAGVALVLLRNALRKTSQYSRLVHGLMLAFLLAFAVASVLDQLILALFLSIAGLLVLLYSVRRYQALGLRMERRLVTVTGLGLMSVVYLYVVNWAADFLSQGGAFGDLAWLLMICLGGILWLPLYAGIARIFSRRTEEYMRKVRLVVAGADRVLDLQERCDLLCESLATQFGFRRCALILQSPRSIQARYARGFELEVPPQEILLPVCRAQKIELVDTRRTRQPELRKALRDSGYHWAVPLWLKGEITGILFLDAGTKEGLEEIEPMLPNLAQDVAQSISVCALVEEKLSLERTLLRREHLAGLGQLAATVAHEVKNPLSSIRAIAQIMSEDPAVQENHERDIEFIESETARLSNTVQQLLAYAKPAAIRAESITPVYEVLETIASAMQKDQASRGVEIRTCLDEMLRRWKAPGELLREVVINLLVNAFEFSSNGMAVEMTAALSQPGQCVIDVTDAGPGIPESAQHKIFEPFFSTRDKGTGLGLATVRKNVNELGGKVEVFSPVCNGKGSRFRVHLPVSALEAET